MLNNIEVITKASVRRGEVPELQGKLVDLDFGEDRARGIVVYQKGTKIKLTEADAIESGICSGVNLDWDNFVSGVAIS